jgi:sigma-B regulation protein RsbU (phosphoserine phosphatase)
MKRNSSLYEFDALINTTPLAVVITDGEGIIEVVNAKAEVMFGYESRELLGKTIEVLMPEGLRENHLKHRADYIAKPFTRLMGIGVDLIGRRKGGEEFPVEIGLNYHQNGDGIQVISYITDITMRKQVEQDRINLIETEKASMEQELHMAHQVQLDLLPGEIPKIPGWSFAVKWLPAGEVAGDFYDFIVRNHTDVDLVIADVIDKGMPAALFMVFAHTALRAYIDSGFSLIDGITRTNRLMCQESSQGLFVTLFLTCLNPKTGETFYVNAGHNPPLHYQYKLDRFTSLHKTGMALGIDAQATYEERAMQLQPGDFILFYTDGVIEAFNAGGQDFGTKRLQQVISDHRYAAAEEIMMSLATAVEEFIAPASPADDITIMVVKRL